MVTLINTQTNYSVNLETEHFKLTAKAILLKDSLISSFNGSFLDMEGNYLGNFSYSENEDGKVSKNIYDVDKENFQELEELLAEALQELKNELNDNE